MGGDTALVLGGGGLTGIGWEAGILCGLAEAGVNLFDAELVVGTSAGSVVGAQLASGLLTPRELYERQTGDASGERAARLGPGLLARYAGAMLRAKDARAYGARLGAMALAAETEPEEVRREVLAGRLVSQEWPDGPELPELLVTAVDAVTGEFRAFGRDSGATLLEAVGASCAVPGVWPPVTIGGRRWIDGGMRSGTNADLAAGYRRVVVLAPMPGGAGVLASARSLAEGLRAGGSSVLLVSPSREARRAFGRNVLDPARRRPAAEAGLAQAEGVAAEAASLWG
ncbi:patatin-like phospholipase family protein [Streptomyces sp. NPDC086023]|uniref:patatin-like phospholipase family protein n=1 Tax=Streptomyces sp. NPDC086023 TaxID=3365746 RepID=UPI0037CE0757